MKATNVTKQDLFTALELTNKVFDDNITFNRYPESANNKGTAFNFTLQVLSSKGKGARRGFSGQRMISACWHVHGVFFDKLFSINEKAIIKTGKKEITIDYGNWDDFNIGSQLRPLYFSEVCDCNNNGIANSI